MVKNRTPPLPSEQFVEQPAVLQKEDPGGIAGTVCVMGHHEDGGPHVPVHPGHDFQQVFGCLGIQRSGGLVGQQEGLSGHHGPGAGRPLLLAAGYLIGEFLQHIHDLQPGRHLPHPALHRLRVGVVQAEGQADVFLQCQGIQQIKVLEHKAQPLPAEPGQLPGREGGDALPVQQDVPGADGVDGGDAVEQGGLPAARRPHDGNKFPVIHFKADPVQRLGHIVFAPVVFFDVPYLQHLDFLLCCPLQDTARPAPLVSAFYGLSLQF